MTTIGVAIVSYNTHDHLLSCLASVRAAAPDAVVVVDNASQDGSPEMVRSYYPEAVLYASPSNEGYGAAANRAIAMCPTEYVLLLNSDTWLAPDSLRALRTYLDRHPRVAVVGPRLHHPDGTLQASCYPSPAPLQLLLEESGLGRWVRYLPGLRTHYLRSWSHDRARQVPWVLGAALALRRAAVQSVGGFDRSFFMYFEEVDLCRRLQDRGWEVHFAPVTTIVHVGGASTRQTRATMERQLWFSAARYYRRHYRWWHFLLLRIVVASVILARIVFNRMWHQPAQDPLQRQEHAAERSAMWQIVVDAWRAWPAPPQYHQPTSRRRANWRFLLPLSPTGEISRLGLFGGPPDLAQWLRDVGYARQVVTVLPPQPDLDVLVVLHDAHVDLPSALRGLRPGGDLYYEINRRAPRNSTRTPRRVERSLGRAGLRVTGVYWAMPNFEACRRYLPLDVPGILPWYLTTLYVASSLQLCLLEAVLRLVIGSRSAWLAPLVPCFVVTAKVGQVATGVSILAHPKLPEPLRGMDLRPVLLTSGQDEGSRMVVLPMLARRACPTLVFKIASLACFNTDTSREQTILADVRARVTSALRDSIPRPLGLIQYGDLVVGIESVAPGCTISVSSGRWRPTLRVATADLRLAASWLSAFHRQVQSDGTGWAVGELSASVDQQVARFQRSFGTTLSEQRLLNHLQRRARMLDATFLPKVWQHNDFGPWNLYRHGQHLTVIDWEFGGRGRLTQGHFGLPLCDLLYIVTYWSFVVNRCHDVDAELLELRRLFVDQPRAGLSVRAAHAEIRRYMAELAIDPAFLPLLLALLWIEHALHRFDRQQLLDTQPTRAGNQFIAYIGLLAEHVDQLFSQE